jgi:hypothetical protein
LFNKRNFKCDCGNTKFRDAEQYECEFNAVKDAENELNNYNHNFRGLYCYCDNVYDEERDEMAQCICCEDWFHMQCLDSLPKENIPSADYELVCRNCVSKAPILSSYGFGMDVVEPKDGSCSKPCIEKREIEQSLIEGRHEIYLDLEDFCAKACRCSSCEKAYQLQNVEFLFHLEEIKANGSNTDIVNFGMNDVNTNEEIEDAFDIDKIALKALGELPRDRALAIATSFQQFTNQLISGIKEKVLKKTEGTQDENSAVVFTAEDMESVLETLPGRKRNRE